VTGDNLLPENNKSKAIIVCFVEYVNQRFMEMLKIQPPRAGPVFAIWTKNAPLILPEDSRGFDLLLSGRFAGAYA